MVSSCGGGLYTHRYRDDGSRFDNPSVYCPDLLTLISHISVHQPEARVATPELPLHAISAAAFASLASGLGDAAAVNSLVQAQRSLIRAVLTALYQAATTSSAVTEPVRAQLRSAWSVLSAVDRDRPDALAVLLGHPYLRVWAVHCLAQLRAAGWRPGAAAGLATGTQQFAADLGHLSAVAAAAAARGRLGAALTVPVVDAAVHLPTLGRLVLGPGSGRAEADGEARVATVSVITNVVIIQVADSCWSLSLTGLLAGQADAIPAPGSTRNADWQPVRTLRTTGWCVAFDDTDPYRDGQQWPAAPRLTDAELANWQRDFQLAWQRIEADYRAYAPGLAAGLTTLTPLTASPDGLAVSASTRQAFGAVAESLPADPGTLAVLLIQEFQRAKLGAVLDLFDLYDGTDDRLFRAPWGEEKVRLDGLLLGAYTRLAESGERRSAEWLAQASEAIDLLLGSGALTPLGERFVREMRRSAAR